MNSNPARLLSYLDHHLNGVVDLTLFGRAALALGFPDHTVYARTVDIDVILVEGQAETYQRDTNFWEIVEQINQTFAPEGLFISHFFEEGQVIMRPSWRAVRVSLIGSYTRVMLYRPANEDLFLTKLMRFDPIDIEDARFIWQQAGWSKDQVQTIIRSARVPDIPEIREQFALCTAEIVSK